MTSLLLSGEHKISYDHTFDNTFAHIRNVIDNVHVNNAFFFFFVFSFFYRKYIHFEGDKIPFLRVR